MKKVIFKFICTGYDEEGAKEIAIIWGARKLAWNRKQIKLTKDEIDYIITVSKAMKKCWPKFEIYLNWKVNSIHTARIRRLY